MKNSKTFANLLIALFFIAALSASFLALQRTEKSLLFISKQQSTLNIDNNFLSYVNLGQKRLISSLLWIATIIESDHDHYKEKDLNSWMFLRFNTISVMEPLFKETYIFGGQYLSIIKDDLPGASYIYDKGLKLYPNEYTLLRDAGFHYYFEVGNFQKAHSIYKKLINYAEATPLMISTLARMESQEGNLDDAFNLLMARYQQIPDKESVVAKKVLHNLYAIKAERDLDCLNRPKTSDCQPNDLEGNPYYLSKDGYRAAREWTRLRIKSRPQN